MPGSSDPIYNMAKNITEVLMLSVMPEAFLVLAIKNTIRPARHSSSTLAISGH